MDGPWETILWINHYLVAPVLYVLAGAIVVYTLILGFRPGATRDAGLRLSEMLSPALCVLLVVNLLPFLVGLTYAGWKEVSKPTVSFAPSRDIGAEALPVYWRASEPFEAEVRAYRIIAISSDRNKVRVQWALIWVSLAAGALLWWNRGRRSHWVAGAAALASLLPMIMALHEAGSRDDSSILSFVRVGICPSVVVLACATGLAGLLGFRGREGNAVVAALAPSFRWVATVIASFAWMVLVVMVILAGTTEPDFIVGSLIALSIPTAPVAALWVPAIRRSAVWTGVMVMAATPVLWLAFWDVFKPGW